MALNLPDRFPRQRLMFGPSPVHRLDRLSRELGLEIWAKRDDISAELVGLNRDIRDADIVVDPRFAGPDYGLPDDATVAAIRMAARLEGMITDPGYEGKSMAALIAMARAGEIPRGSRVLYVHLGGAPALNAYHSAFA